MIMQLKTLCNLRNIRIKSIYGGADPNPDWDMDHHPYKVTLYRSTPKRQITVPFYMGLAHTSEPTAADVLSCLVSDTTGVDNAIDFDDWCHEFGYDTDSRKAEKTYKQCKFMASKVHNFLPDDFEDFAKAEH